MITYSEHTLSNGLRVVAHRARGSEMAAVNVLYCVGARNESPEKTGFAHLFEHLMFRGTRDVPDFDAPLHKACAENNAFTNNDYTDYYITLPKENLATALWLEGDRMSGLDITPGKLEAEKRVVIEEYNQRYKNQPYGDMWPLFKALAYKVHPYRWPTIGLTPDHVAGATLGDVEAFYRRFYNPANAVLSVAADVVPEEIFGLAERYFGTVERGRKPDEEIPQEPPQIEARRLEVERDVPSTVIMIAFPTGPRTCREHYAGDILSDILAGGSSSRLYQNLVKNRPLFSSVNAYITGDIDPGLFVVSGNLLAGVSEDDAEQALWGELRAVQNSVIGDRELEKVGNKFEAETVFGELNVMNKAMNLGYYSLLGNPELINGEVAVYRSFTPDELRASASKMFAPEKSNTLIYRSR